MEQPIQPLLVTSRNCSVCKTYAKVLDLVEDLIVEREVVGWDNINASILLDLPVLETKTLGLSEKLLLRSLASPVCLSSLLQVTVDSHARETENRSIGNMSASACVGGVLRDHLRLNHPCGLC